MTNDTRTRLLQLAIFFLVFTWSLIAPHDYPTWFLEVVPALAAVILLLLTHRRFRFTELAYWCILIHCIILMIGGHYTYARVPLFDDLKESLDLARNHYDKLGHFAQGFVPAVVSREVLLRTSPLRPGKWLFFIVVCICLAISAFYELVEWWVALALGADAEDFLGTQGYVWDTQSDMALALAGAIAAQLVLNRWHNRQMARLTGSAA